ncbi:hypothetical protein [Planococcus sp. YIM B11945]|uniref:hypothetical protein n=1 Tax=Planococcus sp. YIM B11945 TaxID=3435410 RepID=UPI003D7D376F
MEPSKKMIFFICGKTKDWLGEELINNRYTSYKDMLFKEWTNEEGFCIETFEANKETIRKRN